MPLTLSTVGGVVLIEITVSCGVCMEVLCVITAVEEIGPSAVGLHISFVGAVVIVEPPCCDASPVTGVRTGAITGSSYIISLLSFCSPTIWYNGGVYEKTGMPLTLSTVGGVVLIEITVSCGVCMEVLCVITAAEEIGPSAVGLHISFVGAVVIVEPPCCDASPVTGVRTGAITGSSYIISLLSFCSPTIWYNGGVYEKTGMPLTLSTVGGVVLIEITVSCGVCMEVLCVITAAEEIGPSAVGLHISFVGAVVIVEPPCCDASPVTGVRTGAITGSSYIISLLSLSVSHQFHLKGFEHSNTPKVYMQP
ncbi:unnamed protein product [Lactuca virosa]|uniref:Uncharacterized protein n=1 Tax=Lactuca virosa TaxID=75947 RepID=A0AAU9LG59_9ASTR|nr:unnamed protein product [Lactuca virosa]